MLHNQKNIFNYIQIFYCLLPILFVLNISFSFAQTNIVDHEQFNTSTVPTVPAAWTAGSWNLNYNYSSSCHNAASEPNVASISGGTYNSYFWIPVTFTNGNTYDINIWRKNGYNVNIVFNETADLTTPISTETIVNGTASWQNITFSTYSHVATTTSGFIGICPATGNGSRMYFDDITITETCPAPSTQATNINFSAINACSMNVSWTRGNGNNILIIAKASGAPTDPSNGSTYTANASYGSGQSVGGGFAVYNGSGTNVSLTNLSASTTYYFAAYEYNSSCTAYNLTELTGNQATTSTPSTQTSNFNSSNVGSSQMDISWIRGNGDRVLIVARAGSAVNADPTQGSTYSANTVFGSGSQIGTGNYVIYDGTGTNLTLSNLDALVTYYFAFYEYYTNCNYYNLTELTGNQATLRATKYYINNNSTTNDIFSSAVGNNSNLGTRPNIPKLTLANMLSTYAGTFQNGDTIFVDTGSFAEADLSSPAGGVSIYGAGLNNTTFINSGSSYSDHYFMDINDANTKLSNFSLAKYGNGGASGLGQIITINGVTGIVLSNIHISDNSGTGPSYNYSIYIKANSSVTLNGGGSSCNNKTAVTPVGGIWINGTGNSVTINDFQFIANYRDGSPSSAGLFISGGDATTTVNCNRCRFENNEGAVETKGVALNVQTGIVNIKDCIFTGNKAFTSGTLVGGTIHVAGGTVKISRSKIYNNVNNGSDQDVYGVGIGTTGGSLTIDSCLFSGNGTSSRANDIYINGGTVTCFNSTFSSSATNLYLNSGSCTISDCGDPSRTGSFTVSNTNNPTYSDDPPVSVTYSGSCGTSITLPINLISFSALKNNISVKLFWSTSSEINNNYFTIERSINARDFEVISHISAAGNSNTTLCYQALDQNPYPGINYYRLKQTDYDGNYSYSEIRAVNFTQNSDEFCKGFSMVQESLKFIILEACNDVDQMQFFITDALGKILFSKQFQNILTGDKLTINIPEDFKDGVYISSIRTKYGILSRKFIIIK